jgi:predicted anti-sigma-YlaC factor YlaD
MVEAMDCKEFPLLMSAQVDGYATEREQMQVQSHLRECSICRWYAADLRGLRADLRVLETPRAASSAGPDLTLQIQAALQRDTRLYGNPTRRRQDLIDLWMMRLFSQGIGAVVSLALFAFVVTAVFKPAYLALFALAEVPPVVVEEASVDPAIRYRVLILQPPPPPAFSPDATLLELGQKLPAGGEIIATVKVNHRSGRARLDEVVEHPEDSGLANKLSAALYQKASFQPLRRHEASSNAVIVFGKVNISAHLD